jgi:hypothetical protein
MAKLRVTQMFIYSNSENLNLDYKIIMCIFTFKSVYAEENSFWNLIKIFKALAESSNP